MGKVHGISIHGVWGSKQIWISFFQSRISILFRSQSVSRKKGAEARSILESTRLFINQEWTNQAIEDHRDSFTDLWRKQIWCLNWWCIEELDQHQTEGWWKPHKLYRNIWISVRYCSCTSCRAYSSTQDCWKVLDHSCNHNCFCCYCWTWNFISVHTLSLFNYCSFFFLRFFIKDFFIFFFFIVSIRDFFSLIFFIRDIF